MTPEVTPGASPAAPEQRGRAIGLALAAVLLIGWWGLATLRSAPPGSKGPEFTTPTTPEAVGGFVAANPTTTVGREIKTALAGEVGAEGHWRLVNARGETFSAATPQEVQHGLATLTGKAKPDDGNIAVHVTDESVFRYPQSLWQMPAAWLFMRTAGQSLRLVKNGSAPDGWVNVELRPSTGTPPGLGIFAELSDRASFDEIRHQLARALPRGSVHVLALEPGGERVGSAPRFTLQVPFAGTEIAITTIDPEQLRQGMARFKHGIVLLTGRIDGERLIYQPATGPEQSIAMAPYGVAAREADVDLVFLGANTSRQPGTRNALWLRTDVAGLEQALKSPTLGDLFAWLVGDSAGVTAAVLGRDSDRIQVAAKPAASPGPMMQRLKPPADPLRDLWSNVAARANTLHLEAHLVSAERRRELAARLIPGVPSRLQQLVLTALLLGLLGLPVLLRWWARIWPPEDRAEYGGTFGYRAAQAVRWLAFAAVFLPLAGPGGLLATLLEWRRPRCQRTPDIPVAR